ncbi:MAG: hypothetical protein EXS00_00465 [Phycisphaerales bacterium]|nr:hypothetical protein [Phycisphaerales bacterium]
MPENPAVAHDSIRSLRAVSGVALLILILGGCKGLPETVMDSDLPAPVDMESRYSSDVVNTDTHITAGEFLFSGMVRDIDRSIDETRTRFVDHGWTESGFDAGNRTGRLVFRKGDRQATVTIMGNSIDPAMSRGMIVVKPVPPADQG